MPNFLIKNIKCCVFVEKKHKIVLFIYKNAFLEPKKS